MCNKYVEEKEVSAESVTKKGCDFYQESLLFLDKPDWAAEFAWPDGYHQKEDLEWACEEYCGKPCSSAAQQEKVINLSILSLFRLNA